jgi:DNA-binding XRE family transcriptional regulator
MEDMFMYEKREKEKLAEMLDRSPRHTQYIETRGQHPSLQTFYEIVTLFNISVDNLFFSDTTESNTTQRRQLDAMLDGMSEKELAVITATVKAMQEAKGTRE